MYKTTMGVLPRATKLRKSKRRSDKAVNSTQANKEMIFHVNMLLESVCIDVQNKFYERALVSACS